LKIDLNIFIYDGGGRAATDILFVEFKDGGTEIDQLDEVASFESARARAQVLIHFRFFHHPSSILTSTKIN